MRRGLQHFERWSSLARAIGSNVAARVAAIIAALMVVLALLASQQENAEQIAEAAVPDAKAVDRFAAELERCRTVSAEQLAGDDTCRRVWAENRRRFFAPSKPEGR